jgi:uncharacterized repeat protein (TIGR01451 family)
LHISVNPPPPGRNQIEPGVRKTTGTSNVLWGSTFIPAGISNAWMRLTRVANVFTAYRSSNGVDWIQIGQSNLVFTTTMLVGIGVTAHDNSLLATGTFQNFILTQSSSTSANLAVANVATPNPVALGSDSTYVVRVTNAGPDVATSTSVTNVLPAGAAYVSATPSQGSCSFSAGSITCNLGAINAGAAATITIVVHSATVGSFTNTAVAAAATFDPNTSNNSATAVARVVTLPTVTSVGFTNGIASGSFRTEAGSSYEIQYKHRIDDPLWTTLTTISGDGLVKAFSDLNAAPDSRFYRIVVH